MRHGPDSGVIDWVIDYPETLVFFRKLGIDYSCGGKSLEYACREQGHDVCVVMTQIQQAIATGERTNITRLNGEPQPSKGDRKMAIHHAQPAELVDISPLGPRVATEQTTTLIKTSALEVIQLVLPAGKVIAPHSVPGEVTVQCIEGRVVFEAGDKEVELTRGNLTYLAGSEQHAVRAEEDSSLLVTILLKRKSSDAGRGD